MAGRCLRKAWDVAGAVAQARLSHIPMCLGFMVGDAIYFLIAELAGCSQPFTDLPVLWVFVVTFNMTAPMVAWMRYRHHDRRMIVQMAGSMVALAVVVLTAGVVGVISRSD